MGTMAEQLAGIRQQMPAAEKAVTASVIEQAAQEHPDLRKQMLESEVALSRAKASREKAATLQSLAMAVLTGLSAVAVGFTLVKGSKPLPTTTLSPQPSLK